MIRTVFLLRHAKSSWDDPALDDFDRPLNARGLKAAPGISTHMAAQGWRPEAILCSTARRTRETLALVLPHLDTPPEPEFRDDLYLAEWTHLFAVLRELPDRHRSAMLVGHNPGLEQLATALASVPIEGDDPLLGRLAEKFPTGALAVLAFEVARWRQLPAGAGALQAFIRPRDL